VSAGSEEIVKTLDNLLSTLHTLAPLVRNTHWGVARGSDSLRIRASNPSFPCDFT
jgi:DNA-binding ferritin-like protein